MVFDDSEFQFACEELLDFNTDGWELITECHGFKFYRQPSQDTGLYWYKAYGNFPDVDPAICAQIVDDIEYWKSWDEYIAELEERTVDGNKYLYWRGKYPTPLSDRDYVLQKETRQLEYKGRTMWANVAKSYKTPAIPEVSGVVRIDDYFDSSAFVSDGQTGANMYMKSYDDPKGWIPSWVINWFIKTALPQYVEKLHKACLAYPEYLKNKERV